MDLSRANLAPTTSHDEEHDWYTKVRASVYAFCQLHRLTGFRPKPIEPVEIVTCASGPDYKPATYILIHMSLQSMPACAA